VSRGARERPTPVSPPARYAGEAATITSQVDISNSDAMQIAAF
jgi:hypothetical protein